MKRVLSCVIFAALLLISVSRTNEIVIRKEVNRPYMLVQELLRKPGPFDVEIFGSCHSYTSFLVPYYENMYGHSAYNMANPGETLPISYARMAEQFRKSPPKVALLDIWGLMIYDTYDDTDEIIEKYGMINLESVSLSKEKMEVCADYPEYDILELSFPLAHYKDRFVEGTLYRHDFSYSLENMKQDFSDKDLTGNPCFWIEMAGRFDHQGSGAWPVHPQPEYTQMQSSAKGGSLPPEESLLKYVDKIIALCQKYDVQLITYRAPYISKTGEFQRANYMKKYFKERQIPFYDLEEEIPFDTEKDFHDIHHLAVPGMKKATHFLGERIREALGE